ncbi:MAG: FHA domain-containing protein [Planctomycetota bacterium]
MIVLLQVIDGPNAGRRIQLRTGQRATIGRTDHADYSFADDTALNDQHFMIDCGDGECVLRTLGGSVTHVDGKKVETINLQDGQQISVGRTRFLCSIPLSETPAPDADPLEAEEESPVEPELSLLQLCDYLELEPEVKTVAETCEEIESLIAKLTAEGDFESAVRLRAHTLGNHTAVWWACLCLRGCDPPVDLSGLAGEALDAAETWVKDPTDTHRRDAERLAMATGPDGPCGFAALAAFFSGGNVGHPDYAPVEAEPLICGATVAGALMFAGYEDAEASDRCFGDFLAKGAELQAGTLVVPGTEDGVPSA